MTEQTTDSFEVSPQQEQLWLAEPDGPSSRVQALLRLRSPLEPRAVEEALRQSAERHEILRTSFVHQPGIRVPLQAVGSEASLAFATAQAPEEAGVAELAAQELAHRLDAANGPLVRALLASRSATEHVLILTLSGLCADASAPALLAAELAQSLSATGEPVLEPLQYADFSAWQRELQDADDDEASAARAFWAAAEELSAPGLPFAGTPSRTRLAEHAEVAVDAGTASALSELAARYGATVAAVVQAAWHAVLAASSGEPESTITLISAARRHADLEGALGAFARAVPVNASVQRRTTFAELVAQVDAAAHEASVWQDYAPTTSPALPVAFLTADGASIAAGGIEVAVERVSVHGHAFGLWLTCLLAPGGPVLGLDFDPGYVSAQGAALLARRLERLLVSVAQAPGAPLGELDLLGDAERSLLLSQFAQAPAPAGAPLLHERFAAHAAAAPERTAIADEHGRISYGELEQRANQLAQRLARAGVGADATVGLCTDRSIDMVVGLLGILKAGGAYVPLHFEHPPARLAHQLTAAGARVLVTQEALLDHLPDFGGEIICLDRDRGALESEPATAPGHAATPDALAYVIYTSGSTGTPKGVGVTHGNVANYTAAITARLSAEVEPLVFGLVTSISTDLGNTSVFGALGSGGTLVLVSPVAAADAAALLRQLGSEQLDVLKITPSHIGALLAGGDAGVLPRRWLVIGGERAPWDLVARVRELAPETQILNHYGPTEATIGATTFAVGEGPGEYAPATVPIGAPLAGYRCYVLDEDRRPVPLGAPGRLHIGGAGVARGYIGAAELTAERFLSDPFATEAGARMYDTGDVARWLPDGTLEFLGRVDEQVKIRGYRVEPAEIETVLRGHASVREAVVLARPAPGGDIRLVAYCAADASADAAALKAHLAQWLPEYMLPSAIVVLEALPVTPSGKIDRLALPDPDDAAAAAEYLAPRSPVEQAVAEIWAHVLGVERVGAEDDFFALGGHSLLATQVVAQVRSDFAVELPLHSLFTFPTVASLSAEIVAMMGHSEEDETARLMAELEGLSDEEAERLLASERQQPDA